MANHVTEIPTKEQMKMQSVCRLNVPQSDTADLHQESCPLAKHYPLHYLSVMVSAQTVENVIHWMPIEIVEQG
ncbi:hypothetical protein CDAR_274991 [Caerostris darwini]|uniref:Uncharacterized protein n=1 Tax=Caerostris darwini TaxID=1538125 RepID=A0AAV4UFD5_9ARAC|nr:hypothetical protein CDAR_274991 [Caerostris darwini]